jgi:hypothetical protein
MSHALQLLVKWCVVAPVICIAEVVVILFDLIVSRYLVAAAVVGVFWVPAYFVFDAGSRSFFWPTLLLGMLLCGLWEGCPIFTIRDYVARFGLVQSRDDAVSAFTKWSAASFHQSISSGANETLREHVLPPFDFTQATALSPAERLDRCIQRAREISADYPMFDNAPAVPDRGGTPVELDALADSIGTPLPDEYREFLSRCRYLCLADGINIGGLDHNGVLVAEPLWRSDRHRPGRGLLVIGAYWRFGDGDQLMIDLEDPAFPVLLCLHEHGPRLEPFAPSFSLALWRLVYEARD